MKEAQEEEQPSRWSLRSAQVELTVRTNEVLRVLELDASGLVLMCGGARSWFLSWQILLFCVCRSGPVARLQGLGPRTAAVLALPPYSPWAFAGTAQHLRTRCRRSSH